MKKIALLFFVAIMALPSIAQKKAQYEKTAEKLVVTWDEVCSLSDEQTNALLPVMVDKQKELFENRVANKDNKAALKEGEKSIGKKYQAQIKAIVGEENIKKMNEHWKAQKN